MNNIDMLRQRAIQLAKQISMANIDLSLLIDNDNNQDKYDELFKRLSVLNKEYTDVVKEIYFLEPPIKENGVIEIRKSFTKDSYRLDATDEFSEVINFSIYLCGSQEQVGTIDLRPYHCSYVLGDIGYVIFLQHQGHGYAYQALCLLSELLYEQGRPDFWISANSDNIASIKTIEKYGGNLFQKVSCNDDIYYLTWECPTRMREMSEDTSLK